METWVNGDKEQLLSLRFDHLMWQTSMSVRDVSYEKSMGLKNVGKYFEKFFEKKKAKLT